MATIQRRCVASSRSRNGLPPRTERKANSMGRPTIIFAYLLAVSALADDDLPQRLNFDRYKGMLDHSPFAVASAVLEPAATPNFAKDLYVANAARSADGDLVTIGSTADK